MNTKKLNLSKVSAIIMATCAIGILYINYFVKETADEPIMPIILMGMAIMFYFQKPSKKPEKFDLSTKKARIIFGFAIIFLVTGIAAFLYTVL